MEKGVGRLNLLGWMIKEEWRLHSRLFGSWGFAAFPLVILSLASLTYGMMVFSGFELVDIERGLHYVVFFLGLNVGSIGFVSNDAIENLLDESNLLIFSSRTLPVSYRRVVAAFVTKDLIYYSFLYLTPLVAALVPVAVYFGRVDAAANVATVPLVWLSTAGAFMLGVSLSFFGVALYTRNRLYTLGFFGGVAALVLVSRFALLDYTPLALFESPSVATFVVGFAPVPVLAVAGVYVFDPGAERGTRSYNDTYPRLRSYSPFDDTGLVPKMVLDLTRSSGGIWKILFSVGVLFGVFVFLVLNVPFVSNIVTAPGISFAVLLSVSSVSVYHWINRFDSLSNYLIFPVETKDVIRAKFVTELVVSLPVSYFYLGLGTVLFGFDFVQLALGGVVLPLLSLYVFGATVYLTGLEPSELLLNSKLFAVFTVVVSAVAVPLFIASIAYARFPTEVTVFTLGVSVVSGIVGYLLYTRSKVKWSKAGEENDGSVVDGTVPGALRRDPDEETAEAD